MNSRELLPSLLNSLSFSSSILCDSSRAASALYSPDPGFGVPHPINYGNYRRRKATEKAMRIGAVAQKMIKGRPLESRPFSCRVGTVSIIPREAGSAPFAAAVRCSVVKANTTAAVSS